MNFENKIMLSHHNLLEIQASKHEEDIILLFEKYDRLLRKHSTTMYGFDNDLYSECKITFLKCLNKFSFDEQGFEELYQHYAKNH